MEILSFYLKLEAINNRNKDYETVMDILNYLLCFYFICLCMSVGVARNYGTRTCTWCMSIRVLKLRSLKADAAVDLTGIRQEESGGKIEQRVECSVRAWLVGIVLHWAGKAFIPPYPSVHRAGCPRKGTTLGWGLCSRG